MLASILLILISAEPACPASAKSANGPCDKTPATCVAAGDALVKVNGCRAERATRW
jgi:hypothetical protein